MPKQNHLKSFFSSTGSTIFLIQNAHFCTKVAKNNCQYTLNSFKNEKKIRMSHNQKNTKKKQVFILGSGASAPYGYPTGQEIMNRLTSIENDEICICFQNHQMNDIMKINGVDFETIHKNWISCIGSNKILENFSITDRWDCDPIKIDEKKSKVVCINNNQVKPAYSGTYVRFRYIKEYNTLKDLISNHHTTTIDKLLFDHSEKLGRIGKVLIHYCLSNLKKSYPKKTDLWYANLFDDLFPRLDKENKQTNDDINIVTFNYDLSLEIEVSKYIKNTPRFKEKKTLFGNFIKEKIHHVYGKLYPTEMLTDY